MRTDSMGIGLFRYRSFRGVVHVVWLAIALSNIGFTKLIWIFPSLLFSLVVRLACLLTPVCVDVADYTINYVIIYHKQEQVTPVYRVEVNSSGGYSIWRKSAKIKYWIFHKVNTAYNSSFSLSMAAADIAQIAVTIRSGKKKTNKTKYIFFSYF